MTKVNVSTLKNELSHFLRKVRRGEEVLIMDRDQPVARLTAIGHTDRIKGTEDLLGDLIKRGVVTPAKKKLPSRKSIESHLVKLPRGVSALKALLDEREESL